MLVGSAGGEIICLDYLVIFDRQEIYFLTIFFFHGIKCTPIHREPTCWAAKKKPKYNSNERLFSEEKNENIRCRSTVCNRCEQKCLEHKSQGAFAIVTKCICTSCKMLAPRRSNILHEVHIQEVGDKVNTLYYQEMRYDCAML